MAKKILNVKDLRCPIPVLKAEKMLKKLSQWGYKPEIVDAESLLRVSYESFENRAEAVIALNKIRKENKSAWLLTK